MIIYPNPVNQYFIISGINDKDEISLFTIDGKEINELIVQYLNESTAKVNTELLLDGVYIISVGNITKKIIKISL